MTDILRLPESYTFFLFDTIDSTNDEAKRLIKSGGYEQAVVFSKEQQQGRGRYGKDWYSPEGNLYLSIIIKPTKRLDMLAQASFVAAVALRETLLPFLPEDVNVEYKWPNDVLINGKKVAGILLETVAVANDDVVDRLIVGVGVNVEHFPKEEMRFPATSIVDSGGKQVVLEELLTTFVWHFQEKLDVWQQSGFEGIRKTWRRHARGIGKEVDVHLADETFSGVFQDLDENGALCLKMQNGKERLVEAGEVFFK